MIYKTKKSAILVVVFVYKEDYFKRKICFYCP